MGKLLAVTILSILFVQLYANNACAQVFKPDSSDDYDLPKAILVQLNTYPNKMKALKENGDRKMVYRLQIETDSVIKKMVADFTDNFTYCPVYYYIDTNATLIKNKQFEGIILDKDLRPLTKTPSLEGTAYRIVLFGRNISPVQEHQTENKEDLYDATYTTYPTKPGLVVLYPDFKDVGYSHGGFTHQKTRKLKQSFQSYVYISPEFSDVLYMPYARSLSMIL